MEDATVPRDAMCSEGDFFSQTSTQQRKIPKNKNKDIISKDTRGYRRQWWQARKNLNWIESFDLYLSENDALEGENFSPIHGKNWTPPEPVRKTKIP